jgi:hypothetical protein
MKRYNLLLLGIIITSDPGGTKAVREGKWN